MAKTTKKELTVPDTISKAIEAIAKGIGVAAIELWMIFIRQWLVKGIAYGFTGIVLVGLSVFLYQFIGLWGLIPIIPAIVMFYVTILLVGNPKYYALNDITERLKDFKLRLEAKNRAEKEARLQAEQLKKEVEEEKKSQARIDEWKKKDPQRYAIWQQQREYEAQLNRLRGSGICF